MSLLGFNVITVIIVVLTSLVLYLKWIFRYWKTRGIAYEPPIIPFGNALKLVLKQNDIGSEFKTVYEKYTAKGLRFMGYYFLMKPVLVIFDLELVKSVMQKDFQYFVNHSSYVNEEIDPLSGHLFSLKDNKWKELRAKLTPTFTSGKMKMMFNSLVGCSKELKNVLAYQAKHEEVTDIKDIMARYTTDVIGTCAFGLDCNSLKDPNSKFREIGKKALEADGIQQLKNLAFFLYPEILNYFKTPWVLKDVTEFMMSSIKQTVNYREQNNIIRKDFLHLLIQLKNRGMVSNNNEDESLQAETGVRPDGAISFNELAAQAFVFFLAGFETSSTTLTFCLYELAMNPHIQDKLREEISEVLSKYDGQISYEALKEMTYMDQCVKESLRKYPPVAALNRQCTANYKIPDSDVVIEKGTLVFIPLLGIQRDPKYFPNPEKFDPDRFSEANKSKITPFTYLPFGDGPRVCIGLRFGIMEIKVALATMMSAYRFTLNEKTNLPLVYDPKSMVLSVKGGVWLNVHNI